MAWHDREPLDVFAFCARERVAQNHYNEYYFMLDDVGEKGWGHCRMVRIVKIYPDQTTNTENYAPAVHDNTSHYMSSRYRCRNSGYGCIKVFNNKDHWIAQKCPWVE